MGIQGLLPQLKSIMVPIHIKELRGSCVAVDTYSWLHKGALCCSRELCKGLPTSRHIEYCMRRVNLLRHYGVQPILVFDGGFLPMKNEQEKKRARARKENLARAVEHESDENSSAAFECYQKAVDISPLVAFELIQVLKQENVRYIVAPYEADAQMTFLATNKQVEAVITEDSDVIPFGCPRIIFKMDKTGQGVEFQYSMLRRNKEISFEGFTREMLLEMCILSGCDYLQSLPGMGLKRAHAIIKRFKSYDKVLKHLRYSGVSVPPLYEESFKKALLTFRYQRVYDPVTEDIVHLSDIQDDIGDDMDFLGPSMPKHVAQGIARGDLDPFTKMPLQGENLIAGLATERTSQVKATHSESAKKKIDMPVQKNLLTKYFCILLIVLGVSTSFILAYLGYTLRKNAGLCSSTHGNNSAAKGFASLEAKREFRAPRVSPIASQNSLDSSSESPQENEILEGVARRPNCSAACLIDPENFGNGPPANKSIENNFTTRVSEFPESPNHSEDMVDEKRSPEHTTLRQPRQSIHKPCLGLHKKHVLTNVQDTVEGKTRETTRKVIVRSAYFQHKSVEKNNCDEIQDCLVKGDVAIDESENIIFESALQDNHLKNKVLKRKSSPDDRVQSHTTMHPSSPPPHNGYCDRNMDKEFTESIPEGKFGANISHLGHYSEIAEKSMERFVSVISCFRFSSSGSRASGLRAPLRDVRNTCNTRSTNADFSQFSYVPNKKTRRIGQGD